MSVVRAWRSSGWRFGLFHIVTWPLPAYARLSVFIRFPSRVRAWFWRGVPRSER